MKHKFLSFVVSCLMATTAICSYAIAGVQQLSDGNGITLHEVSDDAIEAPRSAVPFLAEYNDLLNCVVLTCVSPCGDVEVTLESTAGDWYQTVFDTLDGTILIPASGDSGHYTLTLVASDGTTYEGEFYL